MFPSFQLFGKTIGLYTIFALLGIFAAGVFACIQAKKHGQDDNRMIELLLFSSIGALIFGHLLFGLTNLTAMQALFDFSNFISFKDFFLAAVLVFSGAVFYGGLLGGILSGYIYGKVTRLNIEAFSDILAPAIPLFHGFGRIGCFLGGCCYGIESHIGFVFSNSLVAPANHISRFPVQLVEALFNFLLFYFLFTLLKKGKKGLLPLYLFIYSAGRFFIEFLRGDEIRGFIFSLSTSQFISVIIFAVSGFSLLKMYFAKKTKQ